MKENIPLFKGKQDKDGVFRLKQVEEKKKRKESK